MTSREVRTQAELDAAVAADEHAVIVGGSLTLRTEGTAAPSVELRAGDLRVVARESSQPRVEAWGSSQPRVEAWDSSQPQVEAWGSSQPRVVAWGSSQPRVEAWGSSQPRVEAWGSSQPRVEAWDSSQPQVVARDSSQPRVVARGCCQLSIRGHVAVVAAATVAILICGGTPKIESGGFVQRVDIGSPRKWCEHYGLEIRGSLALVFKAVKADFRSPKGFDYTPGTVPVAPDWDGGGQECGKGLHFSPSTRHARAFYEMSDPGETPRYLACPVALADMAVHPDGKYPEKCKARGLAASAWEVTIDGEPVPGAVVAWPEVAASSDEKATPKKRAKVAGRRNAVRK